MATSPDLTPPFNDLERWLAIHDLLATLDPDAPPTARARPANRAPGASLAVLAGSFNPLTLAHTELAQRALTDGGVTAVAYALSVRIVNKERVTGAALEDRILTLDLLVADQPDQLILLLNRGLYVDQAAALRAAYPQLTDLAFIVGYDKLVQIFDPRYYDDRDTALAQLFALASLLVAPRDGQGLTAIQTLLDHPTNRRFAPFVRWLPLDDRYTTLSSTIVRHDVSTGTPIADVPAVTQALLAATHVYAPPHPLATGETIDDYALRLSLLALLARLRPLPPTLSLARLLHLVWSPTPHGHALRTWLHAPPRSLTLADLLARLPREG